MTDYQITRGNKLRSEIREIEAYLLIAERMWQGKLITKTSTHFMQTIPYGAISTQEIKLNNKIKNKMLDVLREEVKELRAELAAL